MQISKEELEKIHFDRRARFRKWFDDDSNNISLSELQNETWWWENEMCKDFESRHGLDRTDTLNITHASNILQSTFYYAQVLREYANRLENELARKSKRKIRCSNKNQNEQGRAEKFEH